MNSIKDSYNSACVLLTIEESPKMAYLFIFLVQIFPAVVPRDARSGVFEISDLAPSGL